jgi:hypothetical protein
MKTIVKTEPDYSGWESISKAEMDAILDRAESLIVNALVRGPNPHGLSVAGLIGTYYMMRLVEADFGRGFSITFDRLDYDAEFDDETEAFASEIRTKADGRAS